MSLHILRHKKWHVWNQDNEDTFTRDENAFMAEIDEQDKRAKRADMEKRIVAMKEKQGITPSLEPSFSSDTQSLQNTEQYKKTLDSEALPSYSKNEEFDEEDKNKKIKEIQALRVPTWKLKPTELPQQPWYAEDLSINRNRYGKKLDENEQERHNRVDGLLKELEDPLREMKQLKLEADVRGQLSSASLLQGSDTSIDIEAVEKQREALKLRMLNQPSDIQIPVISHVSPSPTITEVTPSNSGRSHRHGHRHNSNDSSRHKHHSRKNEFVTAVVTSVEDSELFQQKKKKELEMQKLREERLKRETMERKRSTELLMQQMKQDRRLYVSLNKHQKHINSEESSNSLQRRHRTVYIPLV